MLFGKKIHKEIAGRERERTQKRMLFQHAMNKQWPCVSYMSVSHLTLIVYNSCSDVKMCSMPGIGGDFHSMHSIS